MPVASNIPSPTDYGLPLHYRPRQFAPLWSQHRSDWREKLCDLIGQIPSNHSPQIFFRDDDIGAGGRAFDALCQLFRHHRVGLALAVVPGWLTGVRTEQLFRAAPLEEPLWGWHQHGWRHVNWQRTGDKSEFGEQRLFERQWTDICKGLKKMKQVFGEHFLPVFTPPWNRFSGTTLRILQELDYRAVSTNAPLPRMVKPAMHFRNFRIQLDLHTRKAKDGEGDYHLMLQELGAVLSRKEPSGIMLHHHRMNYFAFEFLNELLAQLKTIPQISFSSFSELLEKHNGE